MPSVGFKPCIQILGNALAMVAGVQVRPPDRRLDQHLQDEDPLFQRQLIVTHRALVLVCRPRFYDGQMIFKAEKMLTVFIPDLPAGWEGQQRRIAADLTVQVQGKRYPVGGTPGHLVTLVRATDEPLIDELVAEGVRRNGKCLTSRVEARAKAQAFGTGDTASSSPPRGQPTMSQ